MRLGLTKACRSDLINPGVRHCNLAVRSPAFPWVPRHLTRFSREISALLRSVLSSRRRGQDKNQGTDKWDDSLRSCTGDLGFWRQDKRDRLMAVEPSVLGRRRVDGVEAFRCGGDPGGGDAR